MTSQRVERTLIGTGGYGPFMGEWVNDNNNNNNNNNNNDNEFVQRKYYKQYSKALYIQLQLKHI